MSDFNKVQCDKHNHRALTPESVNADLLEACKLAKYQLSNMDLLDTPRLLFVLKQAIVKAEKG